VAKPLSYDTSNNATNNALNSVWWGQAKNGDYIVAFFNREGGNQTRTIDFAANMGITVDPSNPLYAKELWGQTPPSGSTPSTLGVTGTLDGNTFTMNNLATRNCRVYRLRRDIPW
jgi:hypothetical protein